MILAHADAEQSKGWYVGSWNSNLSIPIGYANEGINEPHYHAQMHEVYLVARGKSTALVNEQRVTLETGDVLVVEPGEPHTFIQSSSDYFHFVIHTPCIKGDKHPVKDS